LHPHRDYELAAAPDGCASSGVAREGNLVFFFFFHWTEPNMNYILMMNRFSEHHTVSRNCDFLMMWTVFVALVHCVLLDTVSGSGLEFDSSVVSNCTGSISQESYEALDGLYKSTAGWNWVWDPLQPSSTLWQFPCSLDTPCSDNWQGLVCNSNLSSITCDITAMLLQHRGLEGTIPSELGNMVNLEVLYLNKNSLDGSIPSELGNLVNVVGLALYDNSLDGSIPSELGNMVNLEVLYLNENLLDGSIPSELGNLVDLGILDLYENLLDGSVPSELSNLVNLEVLDIFDNLMDGSIPSEFGVLLNLEVLGLNNNLLVGSLPSQLGNLRLLQSINVYSNFLDGSLPSELGNLIYLQTFYSYDNSLYGAIPSELGNLVYLEALNLNDNSLEGSIPSELGNLVDLGLLALDGNSLGGSIPSELGNLVNLEGLYLYSNSLDGSIPSELGNLVNLEVLYLYDNSLEGFFPSELGDLGGLIAMELNDNSLRGTIPISIGSWSLLKSLNLSGNLFSGDINIFSGKNFASLQVLDLSLNRFSGTLPASVFSLPDLQSVILSQNCFSGNLPSSMCLTEKLKSIVLDLLTSSCGSRSGHIFRGIVLKHYMAGTIPSCIWSSSSIRTLHLVGNGLQGSLTDLSNASVLSVLALGSNQLTGTIPISFQRHNFAQLDFSINRLSGTLTSDLFVGPNATLYDLSTNRLSGDIPDVLYAAYASDVLNVLEANLFGCQQNSIPTSDVSHNSYQCGSDNFQYSLVAWGAGFALCLAAIIVATMVAPGSDWVLHGVNICSSREFVRLLFGPVCCLVVCLVGLIGFVAMKLSSGDAYTPTYVIQYWWTSTIAFVHNWPVYIFLFVTLIGICVVFTTTVVFLPRNTDSVRGMTYYSSMPVVFRISAHLVNVVIVTIANFVYVLVAIGNVNNGTLLAIQALLGIFKLSWSSWVIPWLLSRARIHQNSHWLFMVLFVFLGAPFASSFSESSACFLYVLSKPAPISFSLVSPVIKFWSDCTINDGCHIYPFPGGQLVNSTIPAPWIYSYQCASAVITGYAPVLILSYLASGIVVPFIILIICIFRSHWPGAFKRTIVILEFAYFDNATAAALLEKKSVSVLGRRHVVKYILDLGVMMTFGLAVPLLAVAILCDTAFNTAVLLLLLEQFIESCKKNGLDASNLKQEFWNSFRLNSSEVPGCIYIVLGYVSIFWSLFAFDWIADVYGSLAGGLAMLIPLLMPASIGFLLLRWYRRGERVDLKHQAKTGTIELCETGNPVILPQSTRDEFSVDEK
jgi:Leucine-rich repeat (LRR) protein